MGMSDVGLKAGGVLANAGQRSQSTARSKSSEKSGGLGKMLGKVATAAVMASDPRLKTNVEKIGELADGLNVYRYDYINHPLTLDYAEGPHVGVMADEVAAIRPDALGPVVEGYQFVDYSRIEMEGF